MIHIITIIIIIIVIYYVIHTHARKYGGVLDFSMRVPVHNICIYIYVPYIIIYFKYQARHDVINTREKTRCRRIGGIHDTFFMYFLTIFH